MNSNQQSYKPVIVIPAFRRSEALFRLLQSVNDAFYPEGGCTLILSLEGGADDGVRRLADKFQFKHGEKKIVTHSERLGLKSHIYTCAGFSQKYGSVIVLEEDLIVSPAYYHFAVRALQAYQNSESVAGISLYAQRFNETAQLPFEPMPSYYAGYFMMLACSWGQAWTAEQWEAFQKWVKENPVPDQIDDVRIPENIRMWPAESWKREFNWYLLQTGRTIFYPYQSLTTNSSHYGGENMMGTGSLFDVPMVCTQSEIGSLQFPQLRDTLIAYDMYMEADGGYVENVTGFKRDEITLDLYGMKPAALLKSNKWIISSKRISYPEQVYTLQRKPVEFNLKYPADSESGSFFSMVQSSHLQDFNAKRWTYIQLAIHLGTNRLSTGRLIRDNFIYHIKKRLGI